MTAVARNVLFELLPPVPCPVAGDAASMVISTKDSRLA
jgi:hypothetical protein